MSYLTYNEFLSYNTGVEISESEFDTLSFYAETAIDGYLGRKIHPDNQFKLAVATQIALSKQNGGIAYYGDISSASEIVSENLGNYSYSKAVKSGSGKSVQSAFGLFPMVTAILSGYLISEVKVKL